MPFLVDNCALQKSVRCGFKKGFSFFFSLFFQNYSMDCYFRQYWRDERLGFTGLQKNTHKLTINQLSLNVKMLEKIWKPDTYFHNGLSSYLHTITRPNKLLRISEHGDITYSMRYVSSCQCCNPLQMDNIQSALKWKIVLEQICRTMIKAKINVF